MNTLSNVNMNNPCFGAEFASSAIPQCKNCKTGVSVDYIPDVNKQWYVLRASYNRELMAADMLIDAGVYAYVVKHYVWKEVDNHRKRVLEVLLPNMIFAYLTAADAKALVRNDEQYPSPIPAVSPMLSFYYDHFHLDEYGKNPPAVVGDVEMRNFILATCSGNENLLLLKEGEYRFKGGDEVLVNQGEFKGVRGRVIRAKGQQRVLVQLSDFATLATAYIPSAFMSII